MKTSRELHEVLDAVIDGIKDKSTKLIDAVEINNAVGKRIQLHKLELEYHKFRHGRTKAPRMAALEAK